MRHSMLHLLPNVSSDVWLVTGTLRAKEKLLELDGIVDEVLPGSRFRVTLDNGVVVGAYASGQMRRHRIRILAGDRGTLKLSVYDLTKGRINFRHKDERGANAVPGTSLRRR